MRVIDRTRKWRAEASHRRRQWLWGATLLGVFGIGFYLEAFPDGFYLDARTVRYDVDDLLGPSASGAPTFAELTDHLAGEIGGSAAPSILPTKQPPLQVWARWSGHLRVRRELAQLRSQVVQQ